jgi:hypothetical protein
MRLPKAEIHILGMEAVKKINEQIAQKIETIKVDLRLEEKAKNDLKALNIFLSSISQELKEDLFSRRYEPPTKDDIIKIYMDNIDNMPDFIRNDSLDNEISLMARDCKTIQELREKIAAKDWIND